MNDKYLRFKRRLGMEAEQKLIQIKVSRPEQRFSQILVSQFQLRAKTRTILDHLNRLLETCI